MQRAEAAAIDEEASRDRDSARACLCAARVRDGRWGDLLACRGGEWRARVAVLDSDLDPEAGASGELSGRDVVTSATALRAAAAAESGAERRGIQISRQSINNTPNRMQP